MCTSIKARMDSEQGEPSFFPPSALAFSNTEEGMGHNIERAQALQEDLAIGPVTFTSSAGQRN